MVLRVILCAMILCAWGADGRAKTLEDAYKEARPERGEQTENLPDFFKVFSKDGNESLTAICKPKNPPHGTGMAQEITCQFTHVRFQLPSSPQNAFPSTFEEAVRAVPSLADEVRNDPDKSKNEWNKSMRQLKEEMCSTDETRRLETKLKDPNAGPKRRELFSQLLRACSEGDSAVVMMRELSRVERSTCELWVDQFSLEFRHIDKGKWLFTQQQPSLIIGTLKIYELSAEADHYSLWTLVETRMVVGKEEGSESRQAAERTVWSWKNYDAYEIPDQCDFISHKLVQYNF